ncbi:hypothetical protein CRH01_37990 [Chryseobacterium rhizosphaerae]|jgi:hypothetical protein|nr:hypothetical protein CRH01_37990 [Chryseobacterium rhizosphaerae]
MIILYRYPIINRINTVQPKKPIYLLIIIGAPNKAAEVFQAIDKPDNATVEPKRPTGKCCKGLLLMLLFSELSRGGLLLREKKDRFEFFIRIGMYLLKLSQLFIHKTL